MISGALPTELWCCCQPRQNRTTPSLEHQTLIIYIYVYNTRQALFCTGNTNRGEVEVCVMVCISRTEQRVACIILMPIPCRNQPTLNTPMPDKTTDMNSTARVHWCTQNLYMYCSRVPAQYWLSVTVHVVSVLSGYERDFELIL